MPLARWRLNSTWKATACAASHACSQSIINQSQLRINAAHAQLTAQATREQSAQPPETLEVDELFTFVGSKKRGLHRHNRGSVIALHRLARGLRAPHATSYFSDAFNTYREL